jgi:tetratricopeptide (TPR) repeat protein
MERAEDGRHAVHAERLAHHALNGGELARAARYLHLAGQRAIALARYDSGVAFYEAALRALEQQGEEADLVLKLDAYLELYTAHTENGSVEGVQELTDKADALARRLNDRERLSQVRVRQAQGFWFLWAGPRRLEEAIERAREAFALAAPDDLRTRSYAQFLVSAASVARARFREAIQEFDAGVTLFTTMPAKTQEPDLMVLPIRANIRAWQSEAHAALGDFGSALAVAGEAERTASDLGHTHALGFASLYGGHVLLMCGQIERLEGSSPTTRSSCSISEADGFMWWARRPPRMGGSWRRRRVD